MRIKLRIAALLLALAIAGFWLLRGPNLGFTRTSVVETRKDPVTELEVNEYVPGFVPGVDFLGAGLALAGLLAGVTFFMRKDSPKPGKN